MVTDPSNDRAFPPPAPEGHCKNPSHALLIQRGSGSHELRGHQFRMDPKDVCQVPECAWGSSGPLLDQEPFRNIERFDDGLPTQLLSAA